MRMNSVFKILRGFSLNVHHQQTLKTTNTLLKTLINNTKLINSKCNINFFNF